MLCIQIKCNTLLPVINNISLSPSFLPNKIKVISITQPSSCHLILESVIIIVSRSMDFIEERIIYGKFFNENIW